MFQVSLRSPTMKPFAHRPSSRAMPLAETKDLKDTTPPSTANTKVTTTEPVKTDDKWSYFYRREGRRQITVAYRIWEKSARELTAIFGATIFNPEVFELTVEHPEVTNIYGLKVLTEKVYGVATQDQEWRMGGQALDDRRSITSYDFLRDGNKVFGLVSRRKRNNPETSEKKQDRKKRTPPIRVIEVFSKSAKIPTITWNKKAHREAAEQRATNLPVEHDISLTSEMLMLRRCDSKVRFSSVLLISYFLSLSL